MSHGSPLGSPFTVHTGSPIYAFVGPIPVTASPNIDTINYGADINIQIQTVPRLETLQVNAQYAYVNEWIDLGGVGTIGVPTF